MKMGRNFKRFFFKALRQPSYAASVLSRRLYAQFSRAFSGGRSPAPESITLFLTHKCNLRCRMCGQWGDGGVTRKASGDGGAASADIGRELPFENIEALVAEMARHRPGITLFGGEPLLHTRFIDIVKIIKSRSMHCLVITNGFLLEPIAGEVVSSGLDELNISLDGPADLHDRIRGLPGLYGRIMSGLKEVNRLRRTGRGGKPLINIQCTITRYNIDRLEEMIGVAEDAAADSLTFHNLIFAGGELIKEQERYDRLLGCSSGEWEGFRFEPGVDPEKVHDKMSRILSVKRSFSVDFYPNFSRAELLRYYRDPCFSPGQSALRCLSPWLAAYIFPDGEVRPCLNSTYSYGSINDGGFNRLWNGEKAVAFRRELKKAGAFPLCRRCTELYRY